MNRPLKGTSDDDENDAQDDRESQRSLLSSSDTAETETGNNARSGSDDNTIEYDHPAALAIPHPALTYLQRHADFILMPVLPILWCLLLVATLSREDVLSAWGMPLLGIGSATLANAVPGT